MRTLVLVDASNILWKSIYVHDSLSHRSVYTGGLFGFIMQINTCIKTCKEKFGPSNFTTIPCLDLPPYIRSLEFPAYKSNRKKIDPTIRKRFFATRDMVVDLFYLLGLPIWKIKGWEADDLIAFGVLKSCGYFDNIVAMTSDSDLWQLLPSYRNFKLWQGEAKGFFTVDDYSKEFLGIGPSEYCYIRALSGTHNGIPGIPRVGEKTAKAIFREHLENKNGVHGRMGNEVISKQVPTDRLSILLKDKKYQEIISRNIRLIELLHRNFPFDRAHRILSYSKQGPDFANTTKFLRKLGFAAQTIEAALRVGEGK